MRCETSLSSSRTFFAEPARSLLPSGRRDAGDGDLFRRCAAGDTDSCRRGDAGQVGLLTSGDDGTFARSSNRGSIAIDMQAASLLPRRERGLRGLSEEKLRPAGLHCGGQASDEVHGCAGGVPGQRCEAGDVGLLATGDDGTETRSSGRGSIGTAIRPASLLPRRDRGYRGLSTEQRPSSELHRGGHWSNGVRGDASGIAAAPESRKLREMGGGRLPT
mmetsp:Transcript_18172/g.39193  ORF Transcript_18172/g.39193 Transcript_18172/m.39193 type:complete len:218 (+) Transcript_18172:349-1002(+)|eukprot:6213491-Pleurochrysis_carterae.AAC.4